MVSSVRFIALFLLSLSCAQAELRFTFRLQETEIDGVKLRQLVFPDGNKAVTYAPPRGWQYFADEDRLRLSPPTGQPGEAVITKLKLPQPQVLDDSTMKRLTEEVIASAPSGARRVTIVSQQKNPVLIEGKPTFLVIINFELYGTTQSRSVMFLNRDGEQLRFQLTCPQTKFADLQKQFFGSQFSWQNL